MHTAKDIALSTARLYAPAPECFLTAASEYAGTFGMRVSKEELSSALNELLECGHVTLVTRDRRQRIIRGLKNCHCPLMEIPDHEHISITESGWALEKRRWRRGRVDLQPDCFREILLHTQWITLSRKTAWQIAKQVSRATVAETTAVVKLTGWQALHGGFTVDMASDPNFQNSVGHFAVRNASRFISAIQSFTKFRVPDAEWLPGDHASVLLALAGLVEAPLSFLAKPSLSWLESAGFIRRAEKADVMHAKSEYKHMQLLTFDYVVKRGCWMLSRKGEEAVPIILDQVPGWRPFVLARRTMASYGMAYYVNDAAARSAAENAVSRGARVSPVEGIGRWCVRWWDVHDKGCRFSLWDQREADTYGRPPGEAVLLSP